jgi:hypothetical protein
MIVLGVTFGVINDGLSFGGSPTEVLAGLTLAAIGVVTVGLAPFAALRWAPILPTSAQSHDHHRGGAGVMSGAILGAAGASLAGRAVEARRKPAVSRASGAALPSSGQPTAGSLAAAYDKRSGRVNGASPRPAGGGARVGGAARRTAGRVGRGVGGLTLAGGALAAQAAQSGIARGRALADQQTPDVDLPDEERRW